MGNNSNLIQARKAKKDEFYTQLIDIEKELIHYNENLCNKIVYCNCDDYRVSNFVKYFKNNFTKLKLKKLISTNYNIGSGTHYYEFNGKDEKITKLKGNGDFRSDECIEFLKEADVVVTNPPFSLFREYVAQLMEYEKSFLIIGNQNAITYKEIFPYIKNNQLWLGLSMNGSNRWFQAPDDYNVKPNAAGYKEINGKKYYLVNGICWFTNIPHKKPHQPLDLYKKYTQEEYSKYDNYDVIEVSKVSDIPMNYDGVMGVPITYLYKHCPEQFEILGIANDVRWIGDFSCYTIINGQKIYNRILIKRK